MKHSYETFDRILNEILDEEFIAITKDSEHSYDAIHRLEVEGLIYEKSQRNVYWLTKDGFKAIELGGFANWIKYIEERHASLSKNLNVFGNLSISDSKVNLMSDNSIISDSDEVLEQLENMIELLKHTQNMDNLIKAKLIDMYEELQQTISVSKSEKLPVLDNLLSIANNFTGLLGVLTGTPT